ncbi:helicase-related protein [Modestobacter sp. SYSU DS0657]
MIDKNLKYFAYDELDGGQLKPHQAEGIAVMATTSKTVCADPVGAGKTVQAAGLIAHLAERGGVSEHRPVLWLTEGTTLAEQTARELRRFLPALTIRNLAGLRAMDASEERRQRAVAELAHVKVMTFAQWAVRGHLWHGPMSVVILDEVSALKGGGARYTAARSATAEAGRVHAFTATLYENDPMEVWHVYSLLHLTQLPSKRDFGIDFVEWRVYETNDQPWGWISAAAAARFRDLTSAHYFRREDCLATLRRPEYVRRDVLWVPLSREQAQSMRRIDRESWGLERLQRQEQVITGKWVPSTRARRAAQLVDELVSSDRTAKALLIAESMLELDAVAAELRTRGIGYVELRGATRKQDRSSLVEDFRADPDVSVLLGSKVVERGLNLQFCRYLISVGLPDNPARLDQAVGRVTRHGSPYPRVDHWVVLNDHEFDRKAVDRLARKDEQAGLLRSQVL